MGVNIVWVGGYNIFQLINGYIITADDFTRLAVRPFFRYQLAAAFLAEFMLRGVFCCAAGTIHITPSLIFFGRVKINSV